MAAPDCGRPPRPRALKLTRGPENGPANWLHLGVGWLPGTRRLNPRPAYVGQNLQVRGPQLLWGSGVAYTPTQAVPCPGNKKARASLAHSVQSRVRPLPHAAFRVSPRCTYSAVRAALRYAGDHARSEQQVCGLNSALCPTKRLILFSPALFRNRYSYYSVILRAQALGTPSRKEEMDPLLGNLQGERFQGSWCGREARCPRWRLLRESRRPPGISACPVHHGCSLQPMPVPPKHSPTTPSGAPSHRPRQTRVVRKREAESGPCMFCNRMDMVSFQKPQQQGFLQGKPGNQP